MFNMQMICIRRSEVALEIGSRFVSQRIMGLFGGRISKMASSEKDNRSVQQEVKLNENDIPGAELPKPAELCTSAFLKRWLSCGGAKVSGK